MAEIVIRDPEPGDAQALVDNLRPADRAEVSALIGEGRELDSVTEGLRISLYAWTATVDGEVACIFGVAPVNLLGGQGAPWMLGTPLIDKHRRAFMRLSPTYIARMLAVAPSLFNVVDARNVRAIGWLKRMGFTIHDPQPLGVAGLPFHLFTMEAGNV